MNQTTPRVADPRSFVDWLESLAERGNRAALAHLRRALGRPPEQAFEAHQYVVPFLPAEPAPWEERTLYLAASLFALHPEGSWRRDAETRPHQTNLGVSLARLAQRMRSGQPGIERRFLALVTSEPEDLPERLRHLVTLLRTHDVPIDYVQLIENLRAWDRRDRRVQHNWARSFWTRLAADDRAETPPVALTELTADSTDE